MSVIKIIDTTLRDGEQTPGVAFTKKEKIEIAQRLDEVGVDIIEVGIAAMGKKEIELIDIINNLNLKAQLLTWNRMKKTDIDMSYQTGVKNVHISVPASDIHMKKKLRMTKKEVIAEMCNVICYAKEIGLNISIGAEDASRSDENFLVEVFQNAAKHGAHRARYADTLGILSPFDTFEIIKRLTAILSIPMDFHGHNDFGMGTANALAAFKGGAEWISCSINGLGERAGNTSLEEIIAALTFMEGATTTIIKKKLPKLSRLVERYSGKKLNDLKPIVGRNVFSHESGIHVDGLIKDISVYEALSPEEYGRKRKVVLGKFSGRNAVIHKLKEQGYNIDREKAQNIIDLIRKHSYESKINTIFINKIVKDELYNN
jgi:homocitrate synthase NifV